MKIDDLKFGDLVTYGSPNKLKYKKADADSVYLEDEFGVEKVVRKLLFEKNGRYLVTKKVVSKNWFGKIKK